MDEEFRSYALRFDEIAFGAKRAEPDNFADDAIAGNVNRSETARRLSRSERG